MVRVPLGEQARHPQTTSHVNAGNAGAAEGNAQEDQTGTKRGTKRDTNRDTNRETKQQKKKVLGFKYLWRRSLGFRVNTNMS